LFDVGDDSRLNHFEKRGDDAIQAPKDPLEVLVGPVTRLRAKRFKQCLGCRTNSNFSFVAKI
jgi:hypothetical protein